MSVELLRFRFPGNRVVCAFQRAPRANPGDLTGNISLKHDRDQAIKNREALYAAVGLESVSECEQVHGVNILINPAPTDLNGGDLPRADGMIVDRPRQALLIKTADCQPVFVCDRAGTAIMALHVGWRGNRANFIGDAVRTFCEFNRVKPRELLAVRGPSLGPDASEFVNFAEEWGDEFAEFFDPLAKRVNLWRLTRRQLTDAGLAPENVYGIDLCPALNEDFFSWRRDKTSGRQGNLVWIDAR